MDVEWLTTKRLRAERLQLEHKAEIFLMHKEKRVMETLGTLATTEHDVLGWVANNVKHWMRYGYGIWMFYDSNTGAFVGRGGLRHDTVEGQSEIEVEWAVMPEYWGMGFGTEIGEAVLAIAERCALKSVVAYTKPSNIASIRIMIKLGFSFEREILYEGTSHVLYRRKLSRPHLIGGE